MVSRFSRWVSWTWSISNAFWKYFIKRVEWPSFQVHMITSFLFGRAWGKTHPKTFGYKLKNICAEYTVTSLGTFPWFHWTSSSWGADMFRVFLRRNTFSPLGGWQAFLYSLPYKCLDQGSDEMPPLGSWLHDSSPIHGVTPWVGKDRDWNQTYISRGSGAYDG